MEIKSYEYKTTMDKIDFKMKTITRDKEEYYVIQGVNLTRRYNNYKYI